jgi:dihydroorotase
MREIGDTVGAAEGRSLLIRGGRVVDAAGERAADVLVEGQRIVAVEESLGDTSADLVLDAGGCLVLPGLVDLHTHLREPGREEAETVASGARAAALGGFTCMLAMPNTSPPIDSAAAVREVLELGATAVCDVHTSAAITVGRGGKRLAPMAELAALGVRVFTDDGSGVQDGRLMRRAMEYASGLGVTLAQHCEDDQLSAGGHMHEGAWSSHLGITGIPAEAEEMMVMRDIALVRLTGVRSHFQHLSTGSSIAMVRAAKAGGLPVTAEATTHHFTLTDERCASFDPRFKVNPPLRPEVDRAAVASGLADGSIDCIATDHAPHEPEHKEAAFDEAPPGMLGLQTALSLALTQLDVPLARLVELLSTRPAEIMGVSDTHGGPVAAGRSANLCVVDPAATWVVEPDKLASRSRNTPYAGMTLNGVVRHTVLYGEPVVLDGSLRSGERAAL